MTAIFVDQAIAELRAEFRGRLADARDLLLVAGVAAMLIGASVTAAGLTSADPVPDRVAVAAAGGVSAPHSSATLPSSSACGCSVPRRAPGSLPAPDTPAAVSMKAPRLLHAPAQLRSSESSSFHDWLRDEDDLRRILARMSRMSNHAPRAYAKEASK